MEFGFPEITQSFLNGQDLLYQQFNEVNFYVEDTDREHFYFNILSTVFSDIKFEKIFPLGGKRKVIEAAKQTPTDNSRVYIVDLDFDEILEQKEKLNNLFYLNKYCIENHLINQSSFFELIREKSPALKDSQISSMISFDSVIHDSIICLRELSEVFLVVKKFNLSVGFYGILPGRDFNFKLKPPFYKGSFINNYINSVENSLKSIKKSYSLQAQIKKIRKHFNSKDDALTNIPGKCLLIIIKYRLEGESLISQSSLDSLTYKLSKNIKDIEEFGYLEKAIKAFVKN